MAHPSRRPTRSRADRPLRRTTSAAVAGALLVVGVLLAAVTACAQDDERSASTTERDPAPAPVIADPPERVAGPAADLSEELTGGGGVLLASATPGATPPDGWVERELVAAGTAVSYRSDGPLPTDGRFELVEDQRADYRTRVVVRRPAPEDFSGTVVVEWLNVSGGFDAAPDHSFLAAELVRNGDAWVGVSAQKVGVEGGPVAVGVSAGRDLAGRGLKGVDPDRYGGLSHPGDAFAYDIVTQVGRAVRDGADGVLGELRPERVLAIGESQSAIALTTYANGVQPLTGAFDGFLLHSRSGAPAPLGEGGAAIDIAGAIFGEPTIVRTDTGVPVLMLQTETDLVSVLGYLPARQDDTDRVRLWEVAGTAHADRFLVGPVADTLDCGAPINDGPQRFVVRAALRALDDWVRTGEPPPSAPRLEVGRDGSTDAIRRDADGIALGGIRTPHVDVPVARLSGEPGPQPSVICLLLGTTEPLPPERLAELHGTQEAYLAAYTASTDEAIDTGFVLAADRAEVLADAATDLPI